MSVKSRPGGRQWMCEKCIKNMGRVKMHEGSVAQQGRCFACSKETYVHRVK